MIILGNGIFSVGEKDIALTRGGGQFTLEREYRDIEADGDKGTVKGRTVLDKSVPKLTMNALTIIPDDMASYYPAVKVTKAENSVKITGKDGIEESDYNTVKWTGKTKEGRAVIITVKNSINLENIDWELADKSEVIHALTYVGTYEDGVEEEPWEIEFV